MFDLAAESAASQYRPLRERSLGSSAIAILAHVVGMMALIAIPVSRAITVEPQTPPIQAFVVTPDVFPEVPSVLPAPAARALRSQSYAAAIEQAAAPSEPPVEIRPEPAGPSTTDVEAGAAGGIEGGDPGGVIGGVAGGIGTVVPVARPLARSATRSAPIRTSGAIRPPDLLRRVEPVYPALATLAQISGAVIVEAVVDVADVERVEEGRAVGVDDRGPAGAAMMRRRFEAARGDDVAADVGDANRRRDRRLHR